MDSYTKGLVQKILEEPYDHEWSLQGFGMLRLYLDGEHRLHIWDSNYTVKDVSVMHTHPWDLYSTIIAGEIVNTRYEYSFDGDTYWRQTIRCGPGGGLVGEPEMRKLDKKQSEVYGEGDTYAQKAQEIHVSNPEDGAVSIIKRSYMDDTEHAYVFFPLGGKWVSAEPRPASRTEVKRITMNALINWFY